MKSPIAKKGFRLIQKWYFVPGSPIRQLLFVKDFTGKKDKRVN